MSCIILMAIVTCIYIFFIRSNFKAGEKFLGWYSVGAAIVSLILLIESIIWYFKFIPYE